MPKQEIHEKTTKKDNTLEETLKEAVRTHALGIIAKHKANVLVYLNNSVGIGEHSNIIEAIEEELDHIAKYEDQIEMLKKHF